MTKNIMKGLVLSMFLVGCSSTGVQPSVEIPSPRSDYQVNQSLDAREFPEWFQEAAARERVIARDSRISIDQLGVDGAVAGKAKLEEKDQNYWYYTVEIGTEAPMSCFVYAEYADGHANVFHNIIDAALAAFSEERGKAVAAKYIATTAVGAFDDSPYLLLHTFYTLGSGDKAVSGVLKGLSATTDDSLQICLHNEVGYDQTFFTAFESFNSAFREAVDQTAFFEAIYSLSFSGRPAGYAREVFTADAEGDINIRSQSAMLLPVDESSVVRSDTISAFWSRPDGSIINGTEYTVQNSTLASNFSLSASDGEWIVEGEFQGKPIELTLDHSSWLMSSYGNYLEVAAFIEKGRQEDEVYMWTSIDPASVQSVTISGEVSNDISKLEMAMGPLSMAVDVESNGVTRRGLLKQGPVTLDMELLHLSGEPLLP